MYAAGSMTPRWVVLKQVLPPARRGKMFPKISVGRFVV